MSRSLSRGNAIHELKINLFIAIAWSYTTKKNNSAYI